MTKQRILSLLLAIVMLLGVFSLVACDGSGGVDITVDGDGNVKFNGATVRVSVSAAQNAQTTFSAADKFTKGTDGNVGNDEVLKAVKARNNSVAAALDINVEYELTEWAYNEVFADMEKKFLQSSKNTRIDVYHNDIYGMTRAMLMGYLWNVVNPGDSVTNYFDFTDESWNLEYMKGSTFDENKIYLLAGDYHLDLIRYAYVLFTNIGLFNAAYATPNVERNYTSYKELVNHIEQTEEWYYADMIALAREGHRDTINQGVTDEKDARIGLCLNNLCPRIFFYGSGLSMFKTGKDGKPEIIASTEITPMVELSGLYSELYNGLGVLYINDVLASTTNFMNGTYIMSMAQLGEMESEKMRDTSFKRGILPFPAYNASQELHTVIHDQAEITAVMGNALSFELASAYMQKLNVASSAIHDAYYEDSLGFRYTDVENGADVRRMIDVVWDNIKTPMDSLLAQYICGASTSQKSLYELMHSDATGKATNFRSNFDTYYPEYVAALETVLNTYETLLK